MLPSAPIAAAVLLTLASAAAPETPDEALYESSVRPLLVERCSKCHGAERQKSGLRLDRPSGIRAGGDRGPILVPGDPAASRILVALSYEDEDLQMPPRGRLPQAEIDTLARWIAEGAPMPPDTAAPEPRAAEPAAFDLAGRAGDWTYAPRHAVAIPDVPGAEALDPLDLFVAARLRERGLELSPVADRRAFVRRATFDVTGLPPSAEEVRAFLGDDAPGAYERLVDRLLASPRYAERWARHWLDLVRYAETRGHEFDYVLPNASQYRDYVVRAFDADVPIDRLVREHVAGDLLPDPRLHPTEGWNESVLGTGFWFFGDEVHSPVDTRADQLDRVAGRIDTLSRAFLGLTVACARCHDHKFDAISTRDYYALAGYASSGGYRQVRFETEPTNAPLGAELETLRAERGPAALAELAGRLERGHASLERYLAAARRVLRDATPVAADAPEPADADLLLADFEGPGWGGWYPSGSAFGVGPQRADDAPSYRGDLRAEGRRLATSFEVRNGETVAEADAHVGTLTSPPFVVRRDHLHFLLSGGSHEGETALELLVDGEVVRTAAGNDGNALEARSFDLRDLRGRQARLRLVDRNTSGWGHVDLDQVVLSDAPEPDRERMALARRPRAAAERSERVRREARRAGLDAATLDRWALALEAAARDERDPLHAYARLVDVAEPDAGWIELVLRGLLQADAPAAAPDAETLFDYAAPGTPLLQNGFAFVRRRAGEVVLGTATAEPVVDVAEGAGAYFDPTWRILRPDPSSQADPGRVSWLEAGRTLRTPTFVLGAPRLYYLVRGGGHAYASVDSHRMVDGPLHAAVALTFEDEGLRWVEHDLEDYVGHRLFVELSAVDAGAPLAVLAVAQGTSPPPAPGSEHAAFLRALLDEAPADLAGLERAYAVLAREAARGLARPAADPGELSLAGRELARWLVAHPGLADPPLAPPAGYLAQAAAIVARVRPVSRLAPAMLEGTGVDEPVLSRGSPDAPLETAHRRFLEVFAGPDPAPIETGSGRLGLADAIVASPLFARVWVNRAWHHLFGRGIVASTDDFGRMGEGPTHPDLLEHLAARFEQGGCSNKALLRALLLSRTYRSSSVPRPECLAADPANLLVHHVPLRRLSAEAVRDSILFVCGDLDETRFGAPVPLHLTDFLQGRGRPAESGPLDGGGRRSIYLAVRRNFPMPLLAAFDFPTPAATVGRRNVSNVPAQALALMNDPFVREQAGRLALLARDVPGDDAARVDWLFERALGRPPTGPEAERALGFLASEERAGAEAGAADAEPAGDDGGAWQDLCHAVLNLKEFLFVP